MKEVFVKRIRNCEQTILANLKTKIYGTDTVAYKVL